MKTQWRFLMVALLFLLPSVDLWAEESSRIETEVEEKVLDKAQIVQQERTLIKVADDKIFEFERYPDREEMKAALGLKLPEKVKQQILARGGSVEEADPLLGYESLPEERKQKFHEVRMMFLANAARILNSSKFVFGAGSLVGDAFSFVKIKTQKIIGKTVDETPTEKRTFSVRSHQAVQSILKGIDYKLWSQAPLVIDSNEFGLSISVGALAETGVLRKGGGGAEEVGLSLAYNKNQRAFVFEIFHNSENFDNTKAAISVLGLVGKAGITLGRRSGADVLKGNSFYPPAVPGYSASSSEYFSAGISSSLGLPPPPLADLLTFTNRFERHSLIRVTVSPLVKGYVRLEFGDVRGSMRLVGMRFVDVYRAISDKVLSYGRGRGCGLVFN
ncbi:MAG: hypothetical protein OM95_14220 [Bdellovibrio sp. ArHS]|uniref:hypothetical protein n=1 Tax=Bdellovibrio sp. ArHS TaxID=1569284 RepID=UPI00058292D1|nr:hypothetical protein [Bdellovibrio sp. ArHS]KHD87446.1 MAG: hypothetical protein OM95_14220 [Bdellovibrio sp. ArHS]